MLRNAALIVGSILISGCSQDPLYLGSWSASAASIDNVEAPDPTGSLSVREEGAELQVSWYFASTEETFDLAVGGDVVDRGDGSVDLEMDGRFTLTPKKGDETSDVVEVSLDCDATESAMTCSGSLTGPSGSKVMDMQFAR